MKSLNKKYEKRIVAFIDILGFKEIVRNSEINSSKIELLYTALNFLKNWEIPEKWDLKYIEIEEDAQKKNINNFDIRGKTNTTTFSDSIVVSVKVDNNVNEMISTLVSNLSYIGANLFEKGISFRGAITIGNIIHEENGIVFGQALIDAYQLETKSAKYPRIILSNKLIKELNYPIENKKDRYPYHQYINRFEDGCVGFHQMIYYQVSSNSSEMEPETLKKNLNKIRKNIIDGLDDSFENPEVFEKFNWLKTQYNNLIILKDSTSDEEIKKPIKELNENISGQNIHYSYTDKFYYE
ncbi:hypothetical protein [Chishuiella sp.]|uniref:hypothetical protein n=1 Tax=Chishuiella sp. TaxID=1969467 RepID=UPI0028AB8116|nr:hypothetical protein [Chishuiella sp.]